jgi:hypothetical protein
MEHLIAETNCAAFVYEPLDERISDSMQSQFRAAGTTHRILPLWDSWLYFARDVSYTPRKSWGQTVDDPVCVFHTFGSTGKRILLTSVLFAV